MIKSDKLRTTYHMLQGHSVFVFENIAILSRSALYDENLIENF